MVIKAFPPIEEAESDGLLAFGGDLEVDSLKLAYSSGIFPWPLSSDLPLGWFAPPKRALIFVKDFHISKSFQRTINRIKADSSYKFEISKNYQEVIKQCQKQKRPHQQKSWITNNWAKAYYDFHLAGYSQTIELYHDSKLIGGMICTTIGGMLAGESMFHLEKEASKLCLYYAIELLKAKNVAWFDCQVINDFTESMGATEVARDEFMQLLKNSLEMRALF